MKILNNDWKWKMSARMKARQGFDSAGMGWKEVIAQLWEWDDTNSTR